MFNVCIFHQPKTRGIEDVSIQQASFTRQAHVLPAYDVCLGRSIYQHPTTTWRSRVRSEFWGNSIAAHSRQAVLDRFWQWGSWIRSILAIYFCSISYVSVFCSLFLSLSFFLNRSSLVLVLSLQFGTCIGTTYSIRHLFYEELFDCVSRFDIFEFLKLVLLLFSPWALTILCRVSSTPFRWSRLFIGFDCRVGSSARASGTPEEATQLSLTSMKWLLCNTLQQTCKNCATKNWDTNCGKFETNQPVEQRKKEKDSNIWIFKSSLINPGLASSGETHRQQQQQAPLTFGAS